MKTQLRGDEHLIKEAPANFEKGVEAVGGRIWLTNQRLIFESHGLNFQTGTVQIPLAAIQSVKTGWTRLAGLIPMVPNALEVITQDNSTYRFTMYGRKEWIQAIAELRGSTV
jgi:hypothetical protein